MFVAAKLGIFCFLQHSLPYGVIVKQKSIHTDGYKLLNARSPSYTLRISYSFVYTNANIKRLVKKLIILNFQSNRL